MNSGGWGCAEVGETVEKYAFTGFDHCWPASESVAKAIKKY
jgi:hypothetical protein